MTLAVFEVEKVSLMDRFNRLLADYQDRVYNQVYRMLGSREDAEEATQDIFLKIYHNFEDFRGESKISTWIYRITSNECISRLRRKQLSITSIDEPFNESGISLADVLPALNADPAALLESAETGETIRSGIQLLPARWAMAISLYHFDDLSYSEIADVMEIPTATVATYISRGRKQLAQWLLNEL